MTKLTVKCNNKINTEYRKSDIKENKNEGEFKNIVTTVLSHPCISFEKNVFWTCTTPEK